MFLTPLTFSSPWLQQRTPWCVCPTVPNCTTGYGCVESPGALSSAATACRLHRVRHAAPVDDWPTTEQLRWHREYSRCCRLAERATCQAHVVWLHLLLHAEVALYSIHCQSLHQYRPTRLLNHAAQSRRFATNQTREYSHRVRLRPAAAFVDPAVHRNAVPTLFAMRSTRHPPNQILVVLAMMWLVLLSTRHLTAP